MSSQILLDVHDPSHDQILTWCRYAEMALIGKKKYFIFFVHVIESIFVA